jgi:hypothetical protein
MLLNTKQALVFIIILECYFQTVNSLFQVIVTSLYNKAYNIQVITNFETVTTFKVIGNFQNPIFEYVFHDYPYIFLLNRLKL